jgi:hypothetical protein
MKKERTPQQILSVVDTHLCTLRAQLAATTWTRVRSRLEREIESWQETRELAFQELKRSIRCQRESEAAP